MASVEDQVVETSGNGNGTAGAATAADQIPVENPATGEVIAHVPDLGADDVAEMAREGQGGAARLGRPRVRGARPHPQADAEVGAGQQR